MNSLIVYISLTTCHKPGNVVATKNSKTVESMTRGERGTLVTLMLAVIAFGNLIPPLSYARNKETIHGFFMEDL